MAFLNPWVLYVGVVVLVLFFFFPIKKKKTEESRKVANTELLEGTAYFKKLYMEYKLLSVLAMLCLLGAIIIGLALVARPVKMDTVSQEIYNRDIFICMDVSSSVDKLNVKLCDELKTVVEEFRGERIGITIFNGKSVLLVPLTDDYQYIMDTLDILKKSFKDSIRSSRNPVAVATSAFQHSMYRYYLYEGTLDDEGSSYIGDGLASALYSFPDLETNKERSRLILFTTDNDLNGEPMVTVEEAAELCKKNEVKVFAVAPKDIVDENTFKVLMENTDGGYYKATSSRVYKQLIEDIKKTDASSSGIHKTETRIADQPQTLFVWMLICLFGYFVISIRLKL